MRSETNEKMDLDGHYPQNTISHCIISNETQITLHFFQGQISAIPVIQADLFFAIFKTGMSLVTFSFFNVLLFWFPAGQGLKKVDFSTFLKLDKISHDSSKHFFYSFIFNNHVFAVYFRKKIMDLLASWC